MFILMNKHSAVLTDISEVNALEFAQNELHMQYFPIIMHRAHTLFMFAMPSGPFY